MSSKLMIFSAVGVLGLLAAGVAVAGPRGRCAEGAGMFGGGFGFGHGPGGRLHRLIAGLELTPEQKTSVKEILAASFERVEPRIEAAHEAKRALFEAAQGAPVNEEAVREAGEAAARAATDLTLEFARAMAALRGVLTPEQRQQLDEKIARHRERHEKRSEWRQEFRRERFEEFLESL